ncbi:MAG: flagellin hook IN motif-containing protein [Desulfobacterales bacterium]|jgi:hypothetical protein
MSFYGGINPYESHRFGFDTIDSIEKQRNVSPAQNEQPVSRYREQMDETTRHVLRMRKALEAVRELIPASSATSQIDVSVAASVTSTADVSLSPLAPATATTLQSAEEVNSATTSYSPTAPAWTGASTAQATVSGEYDGSSGTDTLTFQVSRGGTHGSVNLQVAVYDSNNTQIDTIDIKKNDAIDKPYTMNNGLVLTFSAGDLKKNDTFTLAVYDNVENTVDPDKPFNGTGSADPNLQYGLDVASGSFQVNGTTISVQETDTINTVLDKINQSDAGVTATFDTATETVLLTQDTAGSAHDIVLENDTSGFLSAVKLEGATATPGEDAEPEKTLSQEAQFAGVQSGAITVNSVAIDIDVDSDTLTDVLDRMSASAADVTASYNSASERVSVKANNSDDQLTLDSGATRFFAAVNISDGIYAPVNETVEVQTEGVDTVNASDVVAEYAEAYNDELTAAAGAARQAAAATDSDAATQMLGKLVDIISDSMNALFDDAALSASSDTHTETVRNSVQDAVASWFDSEGPQHETDFGIGFDFEKTKEGVFTFTKANRSQFEAALSSPQSAAAVHRALFGTESEGLFSQLHSALTAAGSDSQVDLTGLFLDVTA